MKVETDRPPLAATAGLPGDRWNPYLRTALNCVAVLLFLAVGVTVFVFIHRYAVNMVYDDQWSDINIIRHAHDGTLSFGWLWAQHNEHRILVPNLVVLVLAYTTHFNVVVEDYLNGVLCCATVALLILAHKRRSPTIQWIWYCPVALAVLSFVSMDSALVGFNLIWYLTLFTLAACLFVLDRPMLTWLALAGATSLAVLGSFSSLQGLFIWPAGLVLLALRRRPRSMLVLWAAIAVATTIVYFIHFQFSKVHGASAFRHPGAALRYFFTLAGNVFGTSFPNSPDAGNDLVLLAGIAIFLISIWATFRVVTRGGASGGGPLGVALICYGFIFVGSATFGRSQLGIENSARYVVFVLTAWVGAYLALLEPLGQPARGTRSNMWSRPGRVIGIRKRAEGLEPIPRTRVITRIALAVLLGLMLVQVVEGNAAGADDASGWRSQQLVIADVTANIKAAPDSLVGVLGTYPVGFFRSLAGFARSQHLSLFDTSLVAEDQRRGIPNSLLARMVVPVDGAKVHGVEGVDALVASNPSTTVQFRLSGGALHDELVSVGKYAPYFGWYGSWDTTSVVNGDYELQSVALQGGKVEARSSPVRVVVSNPATAG